MSSFKKGGIFILSSPSGAGKTTLVKKISRNKNFSISISHTTRKPRPNEKNGRDYYFVSKNYFSKLIKRNEFLEHAKVFENYYGSSKKKVIDSLKKGQNVIFDIDWQGTRQIKEKNLNFNIITFFILPPSKKTLHNRLSERENNDKIIIDERMKKFDQDVLHWRDYDFVVVNDNLEICLKEILNIIDAKLKGKNISFDKIKIEDHIKNLLG